jgi:transcriptional regulatory protein RtcR
MQKKTTVISFLGTQLDAARGSGRWVKWRPNIALLQQPDLNIHRMELFYTDAFLSLAELIRLDIFNISPTTEVNLVRLDINDPWDFGEVYGALYDWIRSYPFNPESERYLAHITTGTHVAQICLFLMIESHFIPGVLLQTAPPRRQYPGKAGTYTLIDLDLSRYDAIAARFELAQRDALDMLKSGIATRNAQFNSLIEEIERVAVRSRAPILLTGPTGAGKSHLARRMFELKKARHQVTGSFVEVNCATLTGDTAASTLFGHKKGAFTGASSDRAGLLRTAHAGVLFLDEIGELGLDEQAMLLKAIEEKRFLPMGSDSEVHSDFQLVAATNRDLSVAVAQGRLREDLYARINLWVYSLPGLAQRPEDIEPNIDYLLAASARDTGRAVRFNTEAKALYLRFAQSSQALWTGNFRDLLSSMTRLATLADGGRISTTLVEAEIQRLRALWRPAYRSKASNANTSNIDLKRWLTLEQIESMDLFDSLQLRAVLTVCLRCKNLSEAGRELFERSRTQKSVINDADRLRKYLNKWGLRWENLTESTSS